MRYIGVDLHTTQITVCYLTEEAADAIKQYGLTQLDEFLADLQATDEIAVEATGNTSWFYALVRERVSRVVIVNPHRFEIIKQSVKKTDPQDARNLAEYLQMDKLPEVRPKAEAAHRVQSLVNTRLKMVRLKTSLLNRIHALSVNRGRKLKKAGLSSEKRLSRVLEAAWSELERMELEIMMEQIRCLKKSIRQLETLIGQEAEKLKGFESLKTVSGIGSLSAGILLSVIGEIKDFAKPENLASYFGIVPCVRKSNQTVVYGRITKQGNKIGRTTLVQCALAAMRKSEYLKKYYEEVKQRRGHGKAKIALARKFLGIIYHTLTNNWVFVDFNNFELAE